MATISAKVFEHHQKMDGTFNVKICLYHKGLRKYLDTSHFVSKRQLDSNFNIKDRVLNRIVENSLDKYREAISLLGSKIEFFTCESLLQYLDDTEIDFIKFCTDHIDQLRRENRGGTANTYRVVRNSLIDHFGRQSVSINEVHSNMLYSYERYLQSKREITRINQFGKEVTTIEDGLPDLDIISSVFFLLIFSNVNCDCSHFIIFDKKAQK